MNRVRAVAITSITALIFGSLAIGIAANAGAIGSATTNTIPAGSVDTALPTNGSSQPYQQQAQPVNSASSPSDSATEAEQDDGDHYEHEYRSGGLQEDD